jgi:PAS domain S-box-containing protein
MTLDARKVLSIEKSLKQEKDFISRVLSTVSDIVIVLDHEGRIISFNRAGEMITGYSFEEVRYKPFRDLISPPEEIRGVKDTFTALESGYVNNDYESFWIAKNGNRRRIRWSYNSLTGSDVMSGNVIVIGRDITEHGQAEAALPQSEGEYRNLITFANAPIIVWDPQFRITLFNRAFEHLTGRKAEEVIGQNFEIFLPENDRTETMDLIKKTHEGEHWESVEIPILTKKGGIRTVLWNSASIFGPDGKTIVSTIAQGQDITDRKKIESSSGCGLRNTRK